MMFTNILTALAEAPSIHKPGTAIYELLRKSVRAEVEGVFGFETAQSATFDDFKKLIFPYHEMGVVTTLELFGLDELIIFAFYRKNRSRYRKVADIGANLGLHSLFLSLCGFSVTCFEPDPQHFKVLLENLALNSFESVDARQSAVSLVAGQSSFVRVLGNTTASHLADAKKSYGEREKFDVKIEPVLPLFETSDFIKIDAEGHEKKLLLATRREHWKGTDVMVEVGSEENRSAIFEHLMELEIGLFPQKIGWNRASSVDDLPTSHREGSLFISELAEMPW